MALDQTATSRLVRRAGWLRQALLSSGPVAAMAASIILLSSIPGRRLQLGLSPHASLLAHLVAHLVIYALLGLTLLRALARTTRLLPAARAVVAVALVTAFGVTDELHQLFVPGRGASLFDVAADAAGGVLACAVSWAAGGVRRIRTSPEQTN